MVEWNIKRLEKDMETILFSLYPLVSLGFSLFLWTLIGKSNSISQMAESCSALPRRIDEVLTGIHVEQSRGSA